MEVVSQTNHFFLICMQRTISYFIVYGWWELKLRYCPVKVGLRYTDDLNPWSVRVTNTSRKGNLLSCSFFTMNYINGLIEFTWSSNIWSFSWWGQRMNVSSTYLSHIDGFSDVHPNAISSKYFMYMLANICDNGKPIASPFSCRYIPDPLPKWVVSSQKVNISIKLSIGIQVRSSSKRGLQPVYPVLQQVSHQ